MNPRARADFAAGCAMMAAFGLVFLVMGLVPLPLLWYHPLDHRWLLETRPQGLAIDFFGRTIYASAAAAIAGVAGRVVGARSAALPRERLWLWLGYGLAFVFLAACLMGYQLWPRPARPLPVPAWYHPQ